MQTECLLEPRFTVHIVFYPLAASWRPPECMYGAADDIAVFMCLLHQGLDILVNWYLIQCDHNPFGASSEHTCFSDRERTWTSSS
jgi:hypothetical protein